MFVGFVEIGLRGPTFKNTFQSKLVNTADLDPNRKYLMCSHPHGVMCAGLQCAVGSNACGWQEKFKGKLNRFDI